MPTNNGKLQWHPAFSAALHIEFEKELDILNILILFNWGSIPNTIIDYKRTFERGKFLAAKPERRLKSRI